MSHCCKVTNNNNNNNNSWHLDGGKSCPRLPVPTRRYVGSRTEVKLGRTTRVSSNAGIGTFEPGAESSMMEKDRR